MVEIKIPTVETFLNYFPLEIGGYAIGALNLLANIFASILQLRKTIEMNLKEFHGSTESPCKTSYYGFNELMSSNTVLSAFISFYLISGVLTRNTAKILPFMIYVTTYALTSVIHMMSVHEGHVAFGFLLATFHGYSFIVIYSLFMKFLVVEDGETTEKFEDDIEYGEDDDVVHITSPQTNS
ncbi:CLUMA_CG001380, isoform A [Clunio marinus]|uniref:CLUMA_CG001380, isoform A n=1 Tax=Clunio marinus TaxID=568069 RepID=A0A1J1HHS3_9DIPT|nr:CLUMA_CG001380, isoform A [Clunio marinus]